MTRSILIVALIALIAPAFAVAQDLTPELEFRLQRLAEQRVLEALAHRGVAAAHPGQIAKVSGSAVIDGDHVQVDIFFANDGTEAPVAGSDERFLFTVSDDRIQSLGRPTGEIAILPHARNVVEEKAKADALTRFEKVHPLEPGIPDGTQALVKDLKRDPASGQIHVVCESFGGIAAIWMGDAVRYTYTRDGIFVAQTNL
jgi:hypothetical protein